MRLRIHRGDPSGGLYLRDMQAPGKRFRAGGVMEKHTWKLLQMNSRQTRVETDFNK